MTLSNQAQAMKKVCLKELNAKLRSITRRDLMTTIAYYLTMTAWFLAAVYLADIVKANGGSGISIVCLALPSIAIFLFDRYAVLPWLEKRLRADLVVIANHIEHSSDSDQRNSYGRIREYVDKELISQSQLFKEQFPFVFEQTPFGIE